MSTGKVLLGTLAGIAIGAIAGVLFAPDKGSTTRKKIKEKRDESIEDLKSKFDELRDSISEKFKSTKNDAEELVDKGKEKFDEVKNDIKNAAADYKKDFAAHNNHSTL